MVGVVPLLVICGAHQRAVAGNWSGATGLSSCGNGPVNMADNGTRTFVYTDLTQKMKDATYYARVNAVHLGDIDTVYDTTPDGNTDVDVRDAASSATVESTGGRVGEPSDSSLV